MSPKFPDMARDEPNAEYARVPAAILQIARTARRVTVFTGAGMSAESGLPTYRDAQSGLWSAHDPMSFASAQSWADDPGLVWAWHQKRRCQLQSVEPNAGHHALVEWSTFAELRVITQNIDDLHERAGETDPVHIHGRLIDSNCDRCGAFYHVPPVEPVTVRVDPPECGCGGFVRPSVVWFNEELPEDEFAIAIGHAQNCDLFFIIGCSGAVYPAAGLPQLAKNRDAVVVELNPSETELSDRADLIWRTTAASALPALVAELRPADAPASDSRS